LAESRRSLAQDRHSFLDEELAEIVRRTADPS
jgi:hypothetical protein